MFRILWIEDELKPVEQLAPILAAIPGISLTVLLFNESMVNDTVAVQIEGVQLEKHITNGTMNMGEFWQIVVKAYEEVNPWLIITDLRLPVTPAYTIKTKVGELPVAGVNLTRLLFERTSCRNVIWLTQHGSDVVRMPTFVVRDWEKGGVNIISFPQTFVVDKTNIEKHIPLLITYLTEQLIEEIRTSLNYRIEAPRIAGLFRLLSSDSIKHFFTKPSPDLLAFEEAKRRLGSYDLIPYHDPAVTFGTWLRTYQSKGQSLESLRTNDDLEKFTTDLADILADHMWGMGISELQAFCVYACRHHNVNMDLLDLTHIESPTLPENVIGPVARSLLICALGNVFQNAQQHGREAGRIVCWSRIDSQAIYLVIANEVQDFRLSHRDLTDKINNKRLRGIQLTRSSIDGLNQLHEGQQNAELESEGWGRWGYRTVAWDNQGKRVLFFGSSSDSGKENVTNLSRTGYLHRSDEHGFLSEICSSFGGEWNVSGVMSVLRLPLVRSEDLARRNPPARELAIGA